jgi:alkanesulfonate monooxygenase SsuD/methylene tetrahydromethanopterin reductase-like flavin-dependent oxidoreductase (luciferase family)
MTRISFVDQGPISAEHGPGETLLQTVELAKLADEIGYSRYWLAEHHNVRNMGIAAPEILIGHIADRTTRLRVGSGGIMLPNHAPARRRAVPDAGGAASGTDRPRHRPVDRHR